MKLPRRHVTIGAAIVFAVGVFFGAMTMLGAAFVPRTHGPQYAISDFRDWLVDMLGQMGAGVAFILLGALGAWLVLHVGRRLSR